MYKYVPWPHKPHDKASFL
uniref:Uncharacterized protein n=1 Tax=Rhizophora mucronata TaxID=61149 RepID=A0A2P2J165_RHIMU